MSKRIQINTKLDLQPLNAALWENDDQRSVLIMSRGTEVAIWRQAGIDRGCFSLSCDNVFGKYQGHRVFTDDSLDYGEIEIR